MNDALNIPILLFLFSKAGICHTMNDDVLIQLIWTFVAAGTAHIVVQLAGLQPFRTLASLIGCSAVLVAEASFFTDRFA